MLRWRSNWKRKGKERKQVGFNTRQRSWRQRKNGGLAYSSKQPDQEKSDFFFRWDDLLSLTHVHKWPTCQCRNTMQTSKNDWGLCSYGYYHYYTLLLLLLLPLLLLLSKWMWCCGSTSVLWTMHVSMLPPFDWPRQGRSYSHWWLRHVVATLGQINWNTNLNISFLNNRALIEIRIYNLIYHNSYLIFYLKFERDHAIHSCYATRCLLWSTLSDAWSVLK